VSPYVCGASLSLSKIIVLVGGLGLITPEELRKVESIWKGRGF
jgi:hypothetical protein